MVSHNIAFLTLALIVAGCAKAPAGPMPLAIPAQLNSPAKVAATYGYGKLDLASECIRLRQPGRTATVIWMAPPTEISRQAVRLPNGTIARHGDAIRFTGSAVSHYAASELSTIKIPRSCGEEFLLITSPTKEDQ